MACWLLSEIDITNSKAVPQPLAWLSSERDMHLTSAFDLLRHQRIRSFVDAAEAMDEGHLLLPVFPLLRK